jgi:hypothetical protein
MTAADAYTDEKLLEDIGIVIADLAAHLWDDEYVAERLKRLNVALKERDAERTSTSVSLSVVKGQGRGSRKPRAKLESVGDGA